MMKLSAITIYPIKSAGGVSLANATLDDFGLMHDRRWMVVDENSRFISQREAHRMALVRVRLDGDDLILSGPGAGDLRVSRPGASASRLPVSVWDDECAAIDGSADAHRWFSAYLDRPARLVFMPDDTFRRVNPRYVAAERQVSFADAYPVLLAGEASLADLNARMATPLPMNRFRPNLVVAGSTPFAEDGWKTVRIGEVTFDVVKPCDRCVTTTVDQDTGVAGREPLRTLAQFRRWNGQVYFGQNLVHQTRGSLRVGDPVVA